MKDNDKILSLIQDYACAMSSASMYADKRQWSQALQWEFRSNRLLKDIEELLFHTPEELS